ncbi:MAG: hypothetical protein BMS9Abin13_396 [Patescibacteria group bacterium]|nr:MAG: hypothetical protein BMS9Abin13_396 [Patescibacteria group bacterium]
MNRLSAEDCLALYELLSTTRALNGALAMHRKDIHGACLLGLRQEAVSIVPAYALMKKGIFLESIKGADHRTIWGMAVAADHLSVHGHDHDHIRDILCNNFSKATGGNHGRDGNSHWNCAECRILGSVSSDMGRMPNFILGASEEIRRREWYKLTEEKRPIGITFFGEGAAQQGGIHETMNWSAASNCVRTEEELAQYEERFLDEITREYGVLRGAPMIFVVVNNKASLFTGAADEHGNSNLAARANGYGNMVGTQVDADDPVAFYDVCAEAIERAQKLRSTLIIANTYRGTGHNQDHIQYEDDAFEKRDFSKAKMVRNVDIAEFKRQWAREPLVQLERYILEHGYGDKDTLRAITREQQCAVDELVEEVLGEPDITPAVDAKDRSIFPPFDTAGLSLESHPAGSERNKKMGHNRAFSWIVRELIREDERVVYYGEDVEPGGVLGLTMDISKEFGPSRIFNTPISEEAILGTAAGRAFVGGKPIIEMQFGHFVWDGMPVLASVAPQWYQKKLKFGFTMILPSGIVREGGSGHYHEVWMESYLQKMAGIVVVAPKDAYDLVGLMRAAHLYEGPVAVMLQISAANYTEFESLVPLDPYVVPLGKAETVTEGDNFTVVTYGAACVAAAANEARELAKEGIGVEVIDLRTVWPFDIDAIRRSVQKTGRLAIFHEDYRTGGIGECISASLTAESGCMEHLLMRNIPIVASAAGGDVFISSAQELVWDRLPYERTKITVPGPRGDTVTQILHRSQALVRVIRDGLRYT